MKNLNYIISALVIVSVFFTSCKKEFDDPTIKTVPTGKIITIAEVRAMLVPGEITRIKEDISVFGVVTMDESTGNLYKESFITDETGNLYLRFISSSGLYIGDSVKINLNGSKIIKYNQMLQIDSLHPDNSTVKIATQKFVTPEIVTIGDLSNFGNPKESSQGRLVQIDNVRFLNGGQGNTYADESTNTAASWDIQDLDGNLLEVRTSGYANFASDTLPNGTGSFIGVIAQYNSGLQIVIRDPKELSLNGPSPVIKDFEDQNVTSGGWTTQQVVGTYDWVIGGFSSNYYAKISNYSGSNTASEAWLISPVLDLSNSTDPSFSFSNDYRYSGPTLEVLISTNYDGTSAPSTATWTAVSVSLDTDGNNWGLVSSGQVSLSTYAGNANVYLAYKYTGTNSNGSTWEVDNIIINK